MIQENCGLFGVRGKGKVVGVMQFCGEVKWWW